MNDRVEDDNAVSSYIYHIDGTFRIGAYAHLRFLSAATTETPYECRDLCLNNPDCRGINWTDDVHPGKLHVSP